MHELLCQIMGKRAIFRVDRFESRLDNSKLISLANSSQVYQMRPNKPRYPANGILENEKYPLLWGGGSLDAPSDLLTPDDSLK